MNLVSIIIIVEIIFSALLFLILAYRTFNAWKTVREELLLHSTFFFFAMALIIIFFSVYLYPNLFDFTIDANIAIAVMGLIYDLFYLELSIIYLTIFTNSRTIFESYAPFIIGVATIVNLSSEVSASFKSNNVYFNLFFHVVVISIGIILIILGIKHLTKSKKYISDESELDFINYIIKITKYLPAILIMDGIGFLFYEMNAPAVLNLSEYLFLVEFTLVAFISVLVYVIAHSIAKKAEKLKIPKFLNTIS